MTIIKKIEDMDLVAVDAARIKEVIRIYFHWKTLDTEIKTLSSSRGINFPSEISEYMTCYVLGYYINKSSGGDAIDLTNPEKHRIIEIKGSSAEKQSAPNSFSPNENYDELIFSRLDKDNDILKIYCTGMSSEDIKKIKVNKNETVEDQQKQGRRPRFSIMDKLIEPNDLKPNYIFHIIEKEIEVL